MDSKELQQLLKAKIKRIEDLQSRWNYAKRSHFKAWEAEWEIWPDEKSKEAAKQWERSAHEDVRNVEKELKSAREDLQNLMEKVIAEYASTELPESVQILLQKITDKKIAGF